MAVGIRHTAITSHKTAVVVADRLTTGAGDQMLAVGIILRRAKHDCQQGATHGVALHTACNEHDRHGVLLMFHSTARSVPSLRTT